MKIKNVYVNNLSSLLNYRMDLDKKRVVVFGTNGSGKSSLSELFYFINQYQVRNEEEILKSFLSKKISKESQNSLININIEFDNDSKFSMEYNNNSRQLTSNDEWKKIKVFNENYTNSSIGISIEINLKETELVIGEPNRELESERIKQKQLNKQKKDLIKKIDEAVKKQHLEYSRKTGSKATKNLEKFSRDNFLEESCNYKKDEALVSKREALGKGKIEQKSKIIDMTRISTFFNLDEWEELFTEKISKPELSKEYKELLIKYSDFYKAGSNILNNEDLSDKCPFCLQRWDDKESALNDFEKYLESDYNKKKETVESLKVKLNEYKQLIEEINSEIEIQKKIVEDECKLYSLDYSSYKTVVYIEKHQEEIIDIIDKKIRNMDESQQIETLLEELQKYYSNKFEESIAPLKEIKKFIDGRQSQVMKLNTQIAEHMIKTFWEDNKKDRESFHKISKLLDECNNKITELESKQEDVNTIQDVFNGLLKFIGLEEYKLNSENKLQLNIDTNYDITNEGNRISSAQRKILSLCYFYAEMVSEIKNESDLKDYIIIYDDPIDSTDYIFFHSITSLIENIDLILAKVLKKESIKIGQHIVFTHSSLLYNRLIQNFDSCKKIKKVDNKTVEVKADKIENNYKVYIEMIVDFYKKSDSNDKEKILIGNIIRRVLEIVISFNELNSNNVSIVKDYGKPTLGMIANHLSHENFSKVLNPLASDDELKLACKELFELIKENHPKQYNYIEDKLGLVLV